MKESAKFPRAVVDRVIENIFEFLDTFRRKKTFLLVDPVMGDNGKVYTMFTEKLCSLMKELVFQADVVTPNLTELCLLTDTEKIRMCEVVTAAKADFIKTSTGFSKAGATFDDIALFASHVGENVQIKAAGGISRRHSAYLC